MDIIVTFPTLSPSDYLPPPYSNPSNSLCFSLLRYTYVQASSPYIPSLLFPLSIIIIIIINFSWFLYSLVCSLQICCTILCKHNYYIKLQLLPSRKYSKGMGYVFLRFHLNTFCKNLDRLLSYPELISSRFNLRQNLDH